MHTAGLLEGNLPSKDAFRWCDQSTKQMVVHLEKQVEEKGHKNATNAESKKRC